MKSTQPAIFNVSHRLAEKAAHTWVVERRRDNPRMHLWYRPESEEHPWKKREWALLRRAFDAGDRWMLRPFQQVCGFERHPTGSSTLKAWRACRTRLLSSSLPFDEALTFCWHSGRVFLELWIQNERFPA